jgi:hypothetical protein
VSAFANAGPPREIMWFEFKGDLTLSRISLFEVLVCDDDLCQMQRVVAKIALCDGVACGSASDNSSDVTCALQRCRYYGTLIAGVRRIRVYSDDVAYLSQPWTPQVNPQFSEAFDVTLAGTGLRLISARVPTSLLPLTGTIPLLILTIVVESIVMAIVSRVRGHKNIEIVRHIMAMIGVNLLSFPLVWVLIPTFEQFSDQTGDSLAVTLSCAGLILALLVAGVISAETRSARIAMIILTSLAVIVSTGLLLFNQLLVTMYHADQVVRRVDGLSPLAVLVIAETVAPVLETVGLWVYLRRRLALRMCAVIAIMANLASFLAGVLATW